MNATTMTVPIVPNGPATQEALESLYETGHWLHSRRRFKDAAAVFRVMVLCAPEDERGYLALGSCQEGLGQPSVAFETYGRAMIYAPSAPRCRVARARLLRSSGLHGDAEAALDEVERLAREANDDDLRLLVASARS